MKAVQAGSNSFQHKDGIKARDGGKTFQSLVGAKTVRHDGGLLLASGAPCGATSGALRGAGVDYREVAKRLTLGPSDRPSHPTAAARQPSSSAHAAPGATRAAAVAQSPWLSPTRQTAATHDPHSPDGSLAGSLDGSPIRGGGGSGQSAPLWADLVATADPLGGGGSGVGDGGDWRSGLGSSLSSGGGAANGDNANDEDDDDDDDADDDDVEWAAWERQWAEVAAWIEHLRGEREHAQRTEERTPLSSSGASGACASPPGATRRGGAGSHTSPPLRGEGAAGATAGGGSKCGRRRAQRGGSGDLWARIQAFEAAVKTRRTAGATAGVASDGDDLGEMIPWPAEDESALGIVVGDGPKEKYGRKTVTLSVLLCALARFLRILALPSSPLLGTLPLIPLHPHRPSVLYLPPPRACARPRRAKLRAALLFWHPDHFRRLLAASHAPQTRKRLAHAEAARQPATAPAAKALETATAAALARAHEVTRRIIAEKAREGL